MGALRDFAAVVARPPVPKPKSTRGRFRGRPAPQRPHAEDRWYDEGGNTQTAALPARKT